MEGIPSCQQLTSLNKVVQQFKPKVTCDEKYVTTDKVKQKLRHVGPNKIGSSKSSITRLRPASFAL